MSKGQRRQKQERTSAAPDPAHPSPAVFATGLVLLLVSAGLATAMVIQHVAGIELPGCGAKSGCDQITGGPWGSLFGWPVSHLGAAWFLALAAAWAMTRGALPPPARWLVRLGVLGSLGFVAIMVFIERQFCPYCAGAHAGNLAFWILMESAAGRFKAGLPARALGAAAAVFLAATAVLVVAEANARARFESDQGDALNESIGAAIEGRGAPLVGRWLVGPEDAQIRIVIISDYQCPDCYKIETQLDQIMAAPPEGVTISFSAKHFPFCTDCNDVPTNLHKNACWAARAAEAAGRLGGPDAFWAMHQWLFGVRGLFESQAELIPGIRAAGLGDRIPEFVALMKGEEVLADIEADIGEAKALGLMFTPMVFLNGVEMKGIFARDGLVQAVNALAAANPPAGGGAQDRPLLAAGTYVEDWRTGPRLTLPDAADYTHGPRDAAVELVIFGDYASSYSVKADDEARRLMAANPDLRYSFRHYPMDQACNPRMRQTLQANGCLASRLVEAAGQLGGAGAYWKMHDWVLANQNALTPQAAAQAASTFGLDALAYTEAVSGPDVDAAIQDDIATAARIRGTRGVPRGYPALIVNGRYIPRWGLDDVDVLQGIVNEAREEGE